MQTSEVNALSASTAEVEKVEDLQFSDKSLCAILPRDEAYYDFHDTYPELESCCFLMPMDLKSLEDMTTLDYLRCYARIPKRRGQTYNRTFAKWSVGNGLSLEHLLSAMRDIVVCDISNGQEELIFDLVGVNPDNQKKMDNDMFRLICVAAERVIFSKLLKENGAPVPVRPMFEAAEFQRFLREYGQLKLKPGLAKFLELITM